MRNTALIVGLAALALASTGCTRKYLVSDHFVPDKTKVVRHLLEPTGATDGGSAAGGAQLNNYYITVCDIKDGVASNCKQTLVMTNIMTYYQVVSGYY